MGETLRSVGLDVGTTSTQMILSSLQVENQASAFTVPEMTITRRIILYESPVHFTPLLDESHIDAMALRQLIEGEYRAAGITREDVDTGAIIITGETSRKENARAVLEALSDLAGEFVVATAGPDLESRLAAKGAGAVALSEETGETVLHMDIGGGTSNLALIRNGEILDTGCLNVGGRLIRFDPQGRIEYVSPALYGLTELKPGDILTRERGQQLSRMLTEALEMAAGLRPGDSRLAALTTREGRLPDPDLLRDKPLFSFSGGVADCMGKRVPWQRFGDLGPLLGQAIGESRLKPWVLGRETIRATVIGAGCHATQLSGSTVFYQNISFPLRDVPAVKITGRDIPEEIRRGLERHEGTAVLMLPVLLEPDYETLRRLARDIARGVGAAPALICLRQDLGKALGQALALTMGREAKILCIDRVALGEESYLDVGTPLGPAIPVVVKTLILK